MTMVMTVFIIRFLYLKTFGRFMRRFRIEEHWSIAFYWASQLRIPNEVPLSKFFPLPDDKRRMYADPFVFEKNGKKWVFVEELEYSTGKGVISCAMLTRGLPLPRPSLVLSRPYHLSYPFVFEDGGETYMIPETGANRAVELYRALSFPDGWSLHKTLIRDVALYDATVVRHDGRWWIFAALEHEGGTAQDELGIFYSDSLEGPWSAHLCNPVKSDCRSSRPGGRIVAQDGRLFRPAQDCERTYGSALVWLEVEELTPATFREKEIARWCGRDAQADGLHTYDYDGELAVIDVRRKMWRL
jgi:hypothetical protein